MIEAVRGEWVVAAGGAVLIAASAVWVYTAR